MRASTIVPNDAYVERRLTQIKAACDQSDGDAAVAVIRLIESNGYPQFARDLTRRLVELGLQRMAGVR